MLLAILHETGSSLSDLVADLPDHQETTAIKRFIFAEQVDGFRYANFDAAYTLANATVDEFETAWHSLFKKRSDQDRGKAVEYRAYGKTRMTPSHGSSLSGGKRSSLPE